MPPILSGTVDPGLTRFSVYRLALIGFGLAVALGRWMLIARRPPGIRLRAGENDRERIAAMGGQHPRLLDDRLCPGRGATGAITPEIERRYPGL